MMSTKHLIPCVTALLCATGGCGSGSQQASDQSLDLPSNSILTETCGYIRSHMSQLGLQSGTPTDSESCHIEGTTPLTDFDTEIDPLESLKESLIENGWSEALEFSADGPGTSSYRVVKDRLYCQVEGGAPAWIDDDSEIRQSNEYFMKVDCLIKP